MLYIITWVVIIQGKDVIIDLQENTIATRRREHDQGHERELRGSGCKLFEKIQSFIQ